MFLVNGKYVANLEDLQYEVAQLVESKPFESVNVEIKKAPDVAEMIDAVVDDLEDFHKRDRSGFWEHVRDLERNRWSQLLGSSPVVDSNLRQDLIEVWAMLTAFILPTD